MKYEKEILTALAENYRRSKKDTGSNKTNRRTQLRPEKLYKKYNANEGDFEEISKLNEAVEKLSRKGFITAEAEAFGTRLKCIYLVDERVQEIEQYLSECYEYVPKDMKLTYLQGLIETYQNASPICSRECSILADNVRKRKLPQNMELLDDILKAVAFIENNQEDLYIREISMKVYGDSKFFEDTTLQPVCNILRKYADRNSENELSDEILLDYHIAKEPQKLCIKGNAVIRISGKNVDISGFIEGVEFLVSDLRNIQAVKLMAPEFMTIENKASYYRYCADNVVIFYLGGYANRYQRDFLKLVYASNPNAVYQHFGDIDAGGFWIHHHLCEITGIEFGLFAMSVEELQNKNYARCLHPLTKNDISRLQELKEIEAYMEVVSYMLAAGVKLEQEIVSLELMGKGEVL